MFLFCFRSTAMGVAETLLKENSNRTEILARILPNMASAADARMLVAKLLNNNKIEVQKLRREVGFALKPMLGNIFFLFCVGFFFCVKTYFCTESVASLSVNCTATASD